MTNTHGSFIWYEYLAADTAAAKSFYEPVIGWSVQPHGSGDLDYRMIQAGDGLVGGMMGLTQQMRDGGAKTGWFGYIGVDDVDATVAAAIHGGATIRLPAFTMPGVGRFAMMADPQGAPFYVMRGESNESSNAFAPTLAGHGAWNELSTSDLAAAKAFYPALFGWTLGHAMSMPGMGDYQFIDHGGAAIGAMMERPGAPPVWNFCFRVSDLDASVERIKQGGGAIAYGPTEVPGGDFVVNATDPDGVPFMLVTTKAAVAEVDT